MVRFMLTTLMSIVCHRLIFDKNEMIFKRCERELDRGLCFTSHFHVFPHTGKSSDFVFSLRCYRITRQSHMRWKCEKWMISLKLQNQLPEYQRMAMHSGIHCQYWKPIAWFYISCKLIANLLRQQYEVNFEM